MFRSGRHHGRIGDWDVYHELADMHHWTPEQVDSLPLEYVYEHLERERARRDVEAANAKRKRRHMRGEDVSLSEIT